MQKAIPEQFLFPPFYEQQETLIRGKSDVYFYFDIAYALGWDEFKPWEDKKETIRAYFAEWKLLKDKLAKFYEKRDRKGARPFMVKGIAYFIDILFWINSLPVASLEEISDQVTSLTYKPVNVEERLSYILYEVDHFHAYNQLKALFEELEKIYYKSLIGND